jgi:hypothetical protein
MNSGTSDSASLQKQHQQWRQQQWQQQLQQLKVTVFDAMNSGTSDSASLQQQQVNAFFITGAKPRGHEQRNVRFCQPAEAAVVAAAAAAAGQ